MGSRRKQFAILTLGLALVGAFGLIEGALRLLQPDFFREASKSYHADLGWLGPPRSSWYYQFGGRSGHVVRIETNRHGFRDEDYPLEPHPRVRRIALLGDSFSEAVQVEQGQTFWKLLGDDLSRSSLHYWEALNFGVGGYGTAQELIALQQYALQYRPNVVVLQVFAMNDILNNSMLAANVSSNQDAYRPYLDGNDDFESVTFLNPTTSWLRRHSFTFRHGFLIANRTFGTWGLERPFRDKQDRMVYVESRCREFFEEACGDRPFEAILFNVFARREEQLAMVRQGWAATEAAILEVVRVTRASGARLVVLSIPHGHELQPQMQRWAERLPYTPVARYAEIRLRELLRDEEVTFVGLTEPFEKNRAQVKPYLRGHLNPHAHALVAEILATHVRSLFPNSFPGGMETD